MKNPNIDNSKMIAPDAIVVINQESKIISFNESACRITGYKENDVTLKEYKSLFDDSSAVESYIKSAFNDAKAYSNLSLTIKNVYNQPLNVLASLTPIKKSNNKVISVILVFRDLNEMAHLTQRVRSTIKEITEEKNRFETIFHGVSEGILTIGNNWVIKSFNKSAEKITGYSRKEAKGKKCWSIFKSSVCRNGCHMEDTLDKKCLMRDKDLFIKHKSGRLIPIRVSSQPLFNSDGDCVGGIETFRDISELKNLHEHLKEQYHFENIIGSSKPMRKIYNLLSNVAQSNSTVLITGESGTGKELVARAIHLNSDRLSMPFVAVNCSAFVENLLESELFGHEKGAFTGAYQTKTGRLELAQNGTLFLDEIGDISPNIQVKLLRVIETRLFERVGGTKSIKLNVRIITATNKNLLDEINQNRFREDLFYRINVVNIHLPPLRNREDDLPILVYHFINKFQKKFKSNIKDISNEALEILQNYNWPGNIRELENVLEHAFVLCKEMHILPECLPKRILEHYQESDKIINKMSKNDRIKDAEKIHVESILKKYDGHRGQAAQALGIDKSTLWRKMKKFKIII